MKNKKIIIIIAIIILIPIMIYIINISTNNKIKLTKEDKKIKIVENKKLGNNINTIENKEKLNIFDLKYQNIVDKNINYLIEKNKYTFNKPLIIYNPYSTNELGINIYFKDKDINKLNYTISVDDKNIKDFNKTLYINNNKDNIYKFQIIGLVYGKVNNIKLELTTNDNKKIENNIKINLKENKEDINKTRYLNITKGKENLDKIDDGLYLIAGRNSEKMALYDKYGVMRVCLNHENRNEFRIEMGKDFIIYPYNRNGFIKVNRLGKIINIYNNEDYRMHHDYKYDKYNNKILYLSTDLKSDSRSDTVMGIDLKTGKYKEIINMRKLLKDIYDKYNKDLIIMKDAKIDWFHENSIEVINNKDVILSSRVLSSLIYIENIYEEPKIKYIISGEKLYNNTNYKDLVLNKEKEFISQGGQHSVIYKNDNKDNKYELIFFNNNVSLGVLSRAYYDNTNVKNIDKDYSKIYTYQVDENNKSYNLIKEFNVPFSNSQGSVQVYNNNYIVASTNKRLFGEYDNNGNLIVEYNHSGIEENATVVKYNFNDFWFEV